MIPHLSKRREALLRSLARRRERKEHRAFIVDGIRVVDEALGGSMRVSDLVVTPDARSVVELWQRAGRLAAIDIWLIENERFAALVESSHPQGLLAVVDIPQHELGQIGTHGPILLLDRLQDPGNAGTLLRSLLAVGGRSVVALRGTVDLYSQKVVRASAGSLFHLEVVTDVSPHDVLPWLAEHSLPLLTMDPRGESLYAAASPMPAYYVLAIGNEATGLSDALLQRADRRIAIPMQPPTESLNAGVAGSLALYEFWRASGTPPPPTPPPLRGRGESVV